MGRPFCGKKGRISLKIVVPHISSEAGAYLFWWTICPLIGQRIADKNINPLDWCCQKRTGASRPFCSSPSGYFHRKSRSCIAKRGRNPSKIRPGPINDSPWDAGHNGGRDWKYCAVSRSMAWGCRLFFRDLNNSITSVLSVGEEALFHSWNGLAGRNPSPAIVIEIEWTFLF